MLDSMGPDAVAIFIGAGLATRANDTEFPFRQESDFWFLTGYDHPNAVAILRTDGGPRYTLFVEPKDRSAETWTGYRPGIEGAIADYGADEAHPCADLVSEIPKTIEKARRIHHVLGRKSEIDALLISGLESLRQRSKLGFEPASEIIDPRGVLHEMRLIKEPRELEIMREAAAISCEAHQEAARLAREECHEYELEAALAYTFRRRGGAGPAYGIIVAGGANATTLHYVVNDQPLRKGELVLIDAGVEVQGYASDVTRTYPVGGRFEGPQRAVYEAVLNAQEAGLASCHPGTTLPAIHKTTLRVLVEGMVGLGLLSGTVDDLIASEAYRDYYMHGTSHWLGLDVHDAGSYSVEGEPRGLEPGMVFTMEPGIYIPADSEKAPKSLRGIGVRIEDDVVITADGHENLNRAIPKKIDDVEAWMR
jgi:Xaa-Pro aminopeptidase